MRQQWPSKVVLLDYLFVTEPRVAVAADAIAACSATFRFKGVINNHSALRASVITITEDSRMHGGHVAFGPSTHREIFPSTD